MRLTLVVNPTSGAPASESGARAVLGDLTGKTIGFFSNNKPNAGVILERIEELLRERFGITGRRYLKRVPSIGAEQAQLDEIRRECDAVVLAGFD